MEIVYLGFFLFILGVAGLIAFDKYKAYQANKPAPRPSYGKTTTARRSLTKQPAQPLTVERLRKMSASQKTDWLDQLNASATEQVNRQLQEQTATVEDLIAQIERIKKKL